MPDISEGFGKTCCFSGHRTYSDETALILLKALRTRLSVLFREHDVRHFRAGGAYGFDMLASEFIVKLRGEFPSVSLTLYLPYPGFMCRWNSSLRDRNEALIKKADEVIYVRESYTPDVFSARNRRLVTGADFLVAYMTDMKSGTMQTVSYAAKENIPVYNLAKDIIHMNGEI